MITITIPALGDAIAVRDRIRDLILVKGETAVIVTGDVAIRCPYPAVGVAIRTENPVRVCLELQAEGFF